MCTIEIRPEQGGADAPRLCPVARARRPRLGGPAGMAARRVRAARHARRPDPAARRPRSRGRLTSRAAPSSQHAPRGSQRHTSVVTVAVLDDPDPAAEPADGPGQVRLETMRGRGRGGQRKNKVETAVRMRHEPTGLTVTRSTGRSQSANIASA